MCIDEADQLGGNDGLGDLIGRLSSQRTTSMTTPYKVARKRVNFAKYIGQG